MAELSGFDSWKRHRPSEGRRGRRTRLAVVGTLGLATVAALFYALFEPFTKPDVHLFAVQLGEPSAALPSSTSERGAVRYAARDSAAFQQIADRIHRYAPNHPAPRISTAEQATDVKSLGRQLLDATPDPGHVLILYLSSTGISLDGEAFLEWPSSEPNDAPRRIRAADVLAQIQRSPARIKLLLLDAGHRDSSLRDSEVVNQFTPLLKTAVEQSADPTLWVLVSHSALENSHVSHRHRRSYFSLAVTEALNGAADRDGDRQIEVGELYRFVAANVSENVRRATGHYRSQTPVLCWGGGNAASQKLAARLLPALKKNGDGESEASETTPVLFPTELTVKSAAERLHPADSRPTPPHVPSLPAILASLSPDPRQTRQTEGGASTGSLGPPAAPVANASGSPVKVPAPAAQKSTPAAKPDAKSDVPSLPPSTPGNIAERLVAAWLLRDRLTARGDGNGGSTPIDFAPHLWRRMEAQLLECERQYRILGPFIAAESEDKTKPISWPREGLLLSRELDDVVRLMRALASRQPLDSPPVTPLERDVAAWFDALVPRVQRGNEEPRTSGNSLATGRNASAAEFDRLINEGSFAEFTAWATKLSGTQLKLVEFHLARRLAEATHLNWNDIRLALTARRYAEQFAAVAADEWNWVGRDTLDADRLLNAAERQLLDGIGGDYRQRFRSILARGMQRYAVVAGRLRALRAARHAYNDAAFRAADVVRWHHATDFGPAGSGPSAQQVELLLRTLNDLSRNLDEPSDPSAGSVRIASIRRLTDVLRGVQTDLAVAGEESVRSVVDRLAAGREPLPGDRLRLQAALRLPFLAVEPRLKALQAADRLSQSKADPLTHAAVDWHGPDQRIVSHDDWQKLLVRAELDVLLAEVGVLPNQPQGAKSRSGIRKNSDDPRAHVGILANSATVRDALRELNRESREVTAADKLWAAHRQLSSALRNLRNGLPRDLMSAARTAGVDTVLRRGRVLVETPSSPFNVNDLVRRRAEQRAALRVTASEQRLRSALSDAAAPETTFLTSTAGPLAAPVAPIAVQPPDRVSLIDVPSETATVRIRNLGTQSQSIKAVVEYDGQLLDVESVAGEATLLKRGAAASGKGTPGRLALDSAFDAAREISLAVGATHELRLTLRRLDVASSQPTRFIVHVKSGEQVLRRSTAIALPSAKSIELLVRTPGVDGPTVGRENGVAALHPFPNRTTEFQFQLRSLQREDRTVDVQLLVPDRALPALPLADLSPAEFAAWRDRMGGLKLLAEQKGVKVPGDVNAVRVTPIAVGTAKPQTPVTLDFGLLVLIRDQRGGRMAVRPVKISVQRPRRYVVPRVSFNAETRRLDIRLSPRNQNWLPSGPVSVQFEIVPRLPGGVEASLGGALSAQKTSLDLFATVPENLGPTVRLNVHVDGFPRAFVFVVPTDRNTESIPEETARRAVRLIVDDKARLASGPSPKVAAKLEVDAPVGSFQKGADRVDVGVDAGRDRKLDGDVFRRLPSDRNATAAVEEISGEGGLVVRSVVADWKLDVSLKDYRNRRVNLLARLVAGGRSTYSNSIAVLADERPPVVEPLRNLSAQEGQPLTVSIAATDEDLAGVEKIEVAVDPGTGQFAKDPPPAVATAGNQGRWEARIATDKLKPGRYRLLIRATDRAGNAGEIIKAPFLVLSKKDAENRKQSKPNRVDGFVVWDGEVIPGATVTLTPQDSKTPAKIAPVTTDKNGEFQFPAVPPGKYVLTAKKDALANKNRTVSVNLTVPETPKAVPVQRVEFP